jgi:hypothetical protein
MTAVTMGWIVCELQRRRLLGMATLFQGSAAERPRLSVEPNLGARGGFSRNIQRLLALPLQLPSCEPDLKVLAHKAQEMGVGRSPTFLSLVFFYRTFINGLETFLERSQNVLGTFSEDLT